MRQDRIDSTNEWCVCGREQSTDEGVHVSQDQWKDAHETHVNLKFSVKKTSKK